MLRRKEVLQNEYQRTQDRLQRAPIWPKTFESKQGGERFAMVRAPLWRLVRCIPTEWG